MKKFLISRETLTEVFDALDLAAFIARSVEDAKRFDTVLDNLRKEVKEFKVDYPIVSIWNKYPEETPRYFNKRYLFLSGGIITVANYDKRKWFDAYLENGGVLWAELPSVKNEKDCD
jgi:GTPase SAR1 family protein